MRLNSIRHPARRSILLTLILLFVCAGSDTLHAQQNRRQILDEIHTVLPFDAIPAIFNPDFVPAEVADVGDNAPMIGVSINGEHHAYSMYLLNGHEIVNDTVGNEPVATTW